MKTSDFPLFGTKIAGLPTEFNLSDPQERQKYFQAKAGKEIEKIQKFLDKNTFLANMVGKKGSAKGTYSQMFAEAVGKDRIKLVSVGDMVRDFHARWEEIAAGPEILKLKNSYRGFLSFEEAVERFLGRSTKTLVPTEFILALLKATIDRSPGKAIFIDGLPREQDQVSYALYFRDLMNYRDDPDVFVLIDVPDYLIDFRIRSRRVCPICQSTKNIKTNPSKFVGYDQATKEFYLMCDNASCNKARMVIKEGDALGVTAIKPRLVNEGKVMDNVFQIHGVPKVFLRNSVPAEFAKSNIDDYEVAKVYDFEQLSDGSIKSKLKTLKFKDDEGTLSVTTFPAAVTVLLIKQLVDVLDL